MMSLAGLQRQNLDVRVLSVDRKQQADSSSPRTAPQLVLINRTLASDSAIHQFFSRVTELKSPTVMDVTGLLVFLLIGLQTSTVAVLREFHFVNQLKTWTEAQSYCREKFYDLATIESADDWTRISELVANSGQSYAWIGLYDDVKSWRWSLDNTSLYERDYGSLFVFNEDNVLSGEHCVLLNAGKLHDRQCSITRNSLCYDETSNSYILVTDAKSWQDAQSYCRQTYTDLASIRNQQELNNVLGVVGSYLGIWVGLSRESWKWSDQSDTSFRLWGPGEPAGGADICGAAAVNGMYDGICHQYLTLICSAPQRKVLKVTLKTDGSMNLNDPLVQDAILKQMEKDLRGQGVPQGFSLRWRKQPHGDVFNKTEL